jgi:hypothetical protein
MKRVASLFLVLMVSTWCQGASINENIQKRLAMGDKPNRLFHEKSPYLLQHAFNPVDWFPWGDEAFAKAKAEGKPIFLSIGYSTCHWCHVMEEESFENARIAEILNKWFVCIKVDREERPDIDQLYMSATQAMTGSGGWPMSVFLFPDGKPFYAGTYFPPQSMYGRPGFVDVLTAIHDAWENKRSDLQNTATHLVGELKKRSKTSEKGKLDKDIMEQAYTEFAKDYNPAYGGFSYAPKFPRPVQFNFLLSYWHRSGNERARDMVLRTLQYMEKGGIWDHVGGGFHRYATDPQWRVPHFEKMLYDQAQIANTYLDAYLITGEEQYANIAVQIFQYVLRDMTSPEGAFYSAEDADSEDPYKPGSKSEGAFYLWTEKEIRRVLPKEDASIFIYRFGIEINGNAPEDPQEEFKGKNILYLAHSIAETSKNLNKNEELIVSSLKRSISTLLTIRSKRKRPHLDDKILVSWNGLMISALARGSSILNDQRLLEATKKAALFIKNKLYDSNGKTLNRRYRDGESGLAGQLDDYAFLVSGLIELYQTDQDPGWLEWAIALTEKQIELFWDKERGGFFDSVGDTALPFRMKGDYDGAEPAGNSVAAMNLMFLGAVTLNSEWIEKGKTCTEIFHTVIQAQSKMLPQMLCAWDLAQTKLQQVVISGNRGREDTKAMLSAVFRIYEPGRLVLLADDGFNQKFLAKYLPFIGDMGMVDNKATAYVCKDFVCSRPSNDVNILKSQLIR